MLCACSSLVMIRGYGSAVENEDFCEYLSSNVWVDDRCSVYCRTRQNVYLCCLTPRAECMPKTTRQAAEANRGCNRLFHSTNKTKELGGNSMGLENALR